MAHDGSLGDGGDRGKNSPSRWRFRPPTPLAFRFRVRPSGSASTYSALRARCNPHSRPLRQRVQASRGSEKRAICEKSTCDASAGGSLRTLYRRSGRPERRGFESLAPPSRRRRATSLPRSEARVESRSLRRERRPQAVLRPAGGGGNVHGGPPPLQLDITPIIVHWLSEGAGRLTGCCKPARKKAG